MKAQGVIGAIVMAAGGMCPLVHVFVVGNWNYFGIDPYMGSMFYVLVVLALFAAITNKPGLMRFTGWAVIVLMIFTLLAVWFKAHDAFGFLHFKKLINLAARTVKFKWGWFVILAGALLMITVRRNKKGFPLDPNSPHI